MVIQILALLFGIAKFVLALNTVKITFRWNNRDLLAGYRGILRWPILSMQKGRSTRQINGKWTCIHARLGDETSSFIDLVSNGSKDADIHYRNISMTVIQWSIRH
jgi:hypothetical protein